MRDTYPALPLPADSLTVSEPGPAAVEQAYATSLTAFTHALYATPLQELSDGLPRLSGKAAAKSLSRIGVLHAIFSSLPDAEAAFRKAITADPTMVSTYVNLSNLKLLENDSDSALQVVKQGLAVNGQSALLNLLASRIYADKGDTAMAAAAFARVQKASPDLASRYPALARLAGAGAGQTGAQRAGEAGASPALPWGMEE